jgi:hypothetical protein
MIDSWEIWRDFQPYALRPYAGEVWLGYDPQESADGDNAALVVVAPPRTAKEKFRVLEKIQFRGKDFNDQAAEIRKLTQKYNVTNIGIDTTGCGAAVWQVVRGFFPTAKRIDYSVNVKAMMVHKGKNVISNRRIEFDAGWTDLAMALMSIHPKLTRGGDQLTYVARRSAETGHGDLAWALLHALSFEALDGLDNQTQGSMEIMDDEAFHQDFDDYGSDSLEQRRGGTDAVARRVQGHRGVYVRGSGSRHGPPRRAEPSRMLVERPVLRTTCAAARPGPRAEHHVAPSQRHRRQGQLAA